MATGKMCTKFDEVCTSDFNTGICLQTIIHILMIKTFQFTTKSQIDCWVIAVKQQKS